MLRVGNRVLVHAYKHDGTLYRSWEKPHVIYEDDKVVVLYNKFIKIHELTAKPRFCKDDTFWIFYKEKWVNVQATIREGNNLTYYINLASPFLFEDETIKYIDYDLDFKIDCDGKWKEVDQKEFKNNSIKYYYEPKLIKILEDIEQCIINKLSTGQRILDYRLFINYFEKVIKPIRRKFINQDSNILINNRDIKDIINLDFFK